MRQQAHHNTLVLAALAKITATLAVIQSTLASMQTQEVKIMAQDADLLAAVAALQTQATNADTAIATELQKIASQTGNDPVVAQAIASITAITAGLSTAAASINPAPAPAAPPTS